MSPPSPGNSGGISYSVIISVSLIEGSCKGGRLLQQQPGYTDIDVGLLFDGGFLSTEFPSPFVRL